MAMRGLAPFHPEDLTAVPPPRSGLLPLDQFITRRQFPGLTVSQKGGRRLLEELLRLFATNARRSPRGRLWTDLSQARLGALVRHPWGDGRRGLHRCTVNRLMGSLEELKVIRMKRRGLPPTPAQPEARRVPNLVRPGAWFWANWDLWGRTAARRLRGFRQNTLAPTFRRILGWASTPPPNVTIFAQHYTGPSGLSRTQPSEEGPPAPSSPGHDPPPPPPDEPFNPVAEIERIARERDW